MRTMMQEEAIHPDIIAKLWQAYSEYPLDRLEGFRRADSVDPSSFEGSEKDLPRQQRRGAIIILGMLAVAKREVVTERLDALLKIGLGPWGKVRPSSAQPSSDRMLTLTFVTAGRPHPRSLHLHRSAESRRQCQKSQG